MQTGEHMSVSSLPFPATVLFPPSSFMCGVADVSYFQVEDAQTCYALYTLHATEWNRGIKAYEDVTALLLKGSGEWYW